MKEGIIQTTNYNDTERGLVNNINEGFKESTSFVYNFDEVQSD